MPRLRRTKGLARTIVCLVRERINPVCSIERQVFWKRPNPLSRMWCGLTPAGPKISGRECRRWTSDCHHVKRRRSFTKSSWHVERIRKHGIPWSQLLVVSVHHTACTCRLGTLHGWGTQRVSLLWAVVFHESIHDFYGDFVFLPGISEIHRAVAMSSHGVS